MCLLIAVRTRIEWIRGTKLNKSPLPIQPAPERMQSRQPQSLDESGTLRRDPIRAPISGDAIQQTNLRLLRLRSALCRTTWTIRRTELRECAAGFGVVAGRVRTAPPQNQIPSRRGRCESMQGECAPQPDNPKEGLSVHLPSVDPCFHPPARDCIAALPLGAVFFIAGAVSSTFRSTPDWITWRRAWSIRL